VYWYNGVIVNSEIARGLDLFKLTPSPFMTENEIAAANTVQWEYLNAQGQPKIYWPATFHLAKAYVDQLDRDGELTDAEITEIRQSIARAEMANERKQAGMLEDLSESVAAKVANSANPTKVAALAEALKNLAG
jgi:hypothetical protein